MRQVLFYIPLSHFGLWDVPIYGYGAMLFVAFLVCTWLASRLARREGIEPRHIQDTAIWIFVLGIIGARITYMIQYWHEYRSIWDLLKIWSGGLVFYGSAIGGLVGYLFAYLLVLRRYHISSLKMCDIIAPCAALGLAIGRIGCLLNGCCYGHVACENAPAVSFPLSSPARYEMVSRGYQTAAGFTLAEERVVAKVEPDSDAARKGLRDNDVILAVNGQEVKSNGDINFYFANWPRGETDLFLKVEHSDGEQEELLIVPTTVGLHPTQMYETISTVLLFFVLMAYYPLRTRNGMVMVLFMAGYAVHRFLNEVLRTDTDPVFANLTLSQNGSILVLLAAVLLGVWIYFRGQKIEPIIKDDSPKPESASA